MSPVLDTSVLVGIENGRLTAVDLPEQGSVCVVTLEELYLGVLSVVGSAAVKRRDTYDKAISSFEILPVDVTVARSSAEIRAEGRTRGVRYSALDSLIAATARVHGLQLLTQDAGMLGMLGVDVRVV